jgi:hypothetical protein
VSDAFVASMVCLQVVSMMAFADAFLVLSTHALRIWSICVLYIARCASGTLETTRLALYFVRKSSQAAMPVLYEQVIRQFGEIMGMTSWRPRDWR